MFTIRIVHAFQLACLQASRDRALFKNEVVYSHKKGSFVRRPKKEINARNRLADIYESWKAAEIRLKKSNARFLRDL